METVELKVEGMTCNNCVRHVREALEGVDGVEKVEVSLEGGRATVQGHAPIIKLIEAVQEEGYKAQSL
jgi:copper chaperone